MLGLGFVVLGLRGWVFGMCAFVVLWFCFWVSGRLGLFNCCYLLGCAFMVLGVDCLLLLMVRLGAYFDCSDLPKGECLHVLLLCLGIRVD